MRDPELNAQAKITILSQPKFVNGLNYAQITSLPMQRLATGMPLKPIKMRLAPLQARNHS